VQMALQQILRLEALNSSSKKSGNFLHLGPSSPPSAQDQRITFLNAPEFSRQ